MQQIAHPVDDRPRLAAALDTIARGAESVDASVPILCGLAANRLYALLGVTAAELPRATDHPQVIARLLDRVAAELSGFDPDPVGGEALSLVAAARRHLEEA